MNTRAVRVADWQALVQAREFDAGYLQTNVVAEDRLRIVRAS